MTIAYRIKWDAGAHAEVEVFRPEFGGGVGPDQKIKMRYTPPLRGTYRLPFRDLGITADDLEALAGELLRRLTERLEGDGESSDNGAVGSGRRIEETSWLQGTLNEMKNLGRQLLKATIRKDKVTEDDLRRDYFLSFCLDENLLNYPWELIYDGEFYCLRHRVGRIVSSPATNPPTMESVELLGQRLEKPSVLVIAPWRTEVEGYDPLPDAREEALAITNLLRNKLGLTVKALIDRADPDTAGAGPGNVARRPNADECDATNDEVNNAFEEALQLNNDINYQIIHFCGHAKFDPKNSSLVLHDQFLSTNDIADLFGDTRPILCFINACNSALTGTRSRKESKPTGQFNLYELGEAFLRTGAYLIGSRWVVGDGVAKHFAETFYEALLWTDTPIGEAVRLARVACKNAFPDDFGWASYVFYGDPRVRFMREEDDVADDGGAASAVKPTG